ncbi:Acyl-CoA synthetase (AMP-forming)/AMP-acid ligase II [Amycolatopsis xylanica]|uniref:Acyl-CoA synthetase (AMP-forming)/AMP-acid ligase II n=1 Tax=Amycolatopsis xylanica TaxID=589385 RepID=A0A1H2V351_9PSEU|nr:fatty acid--CoA ligase family protein [Amycolatopsis xylanica]SDW62389.1 Acyl-CoA synthetase (AMP-forming)/AMP-acid ligase II [Amycolatopsis xylanica]
MSGMTELLRGLFDAHPGDLPYLAHGDDIRTRARVRTEVAQEAAVFAGCGIREGSTVMLQVPPSYTQVQAMLALWSLGAQVMLVDHRFKPAEVDAIRATAHPEFTVRGGVAGQTPSFAREYELITRHHRTGLPAATAHRLVQFSSGSTGTPKVIGRTPDSLAEEIDRFTRIDGMPRAGERVLLLSSTAHSFGLIAGLLHSLRAGVTAVFADRVSAKDILAAASRHDVHHLFGTPFHYELVSTAARLPPLPSLRAAVSGGEIMDPATAKRFEDRFGFAVGESYGTTETGVVAMDVSGSMRPSVGRACPGVRMRVLDGELEVHLPDGSPYLHPVPGDRYRDGWLRTRDRAEIGDDGGLLLFGRGDSLVVIGGLKVDLGEVETVLRGHSGVLDAVVVHDGLTEAYVTGTASESELLAWCRDRLADYKLPRRIRVLAELPRTPNGKLVRRGEVLRGAVPA